MKKGHWQISVFLVVLVTGFVLISGCSSTSAPEQPRDTPKETIAPTPVPSTTIIPLTTAILSNNGQSYSTVEINKHFIDIALGPDDAYIRKLDYDFIDIGIIGAYTDADVILLNNFTKVFNSYSTVEMLDVRRDRATANIVLKFLPESALMDVNTEESYKIFKNRQTGEIIFISKETPDTPRSTTILIDSDLKGDERAHWILRALLYELGFRGETGTYPDSIFYYDSDTTTSLSKLDLKALELMYGKKIYNYMDLTDLKQILMTE